MAYSWDTFYNENYLYLAIFIAILSGRLGFLLSEKYVNSAIVACLFFVPSALIAVVFGSLLIAILLILFYGFPALSGLIDNPAGYAALSIETGIETSVLGVFTVPVCFMWGFIRKYRKGK